MRKMLAVALALLGSAVGCGGADLPWSRPRLGLDPREAFPSFSAQEEAWSFPPCGNSEAREVQWLRLTEGFEIPHPGNAGWRGAEGTGATVLVHTPSQEAVPVAFVYAERIPIVPGSDPGRALRTFLARVDQRFATGLDIGSEAGEQPRFLSDPDSFTGWKWIGPCGVGEDLASGNEGEGPYFKLGRFSGMWRPEEGGGMTPAFLLVGTLTLPQRGTFGAHVAMVCTQNPHCLVAPDLAVLLGHVRIAAREVPKHLEPSSGNEDFHFYAQQVGFVPPP